MLWMLMDASVENILVQSRDTVLSVRLYRRENAETVILLHGGPGVPDEMTEVREILTNRFQVVTFDQRGTGSSRITKYNFHMNDLIEDINTIAIRLGVDQFHLFGHSWGGLYAQIYAAVFPGKILSLFLCSPASGTGEIWNLTEKEVFQYNRNRSTGLEWLGMGLNAVLGALGNNIAYQRLYRQIIVNYHKGYAVDPPDPEKLAKINAKAGNRTRKLIKAYSLPEQFGKTAYPVIITYGQDDAYGDSKKYVLKRFPCAQHVIIPLSGHTPWKHNLPDFREIVKGFYHIDDKS
jgi:proline iminopeptidase